MEPLIVIAVLGLVVWVVSAPLRHARAGLAEDRVAVERDGLLAAKEAKYREIRELELDHRTGKLSDEDFRLQDRARRAEAIEILRALDDLGEGEPDPAPAADGEDGAAVGATTAEHAAERPVG
jgi:signal transduction histidine kinase